MPLLYFNKYTDATHESTNSDCLEPNNNSGTQNQIVTTTASTSLKGF